MRTITLEKTLYTFDELSESAKQHACERYNRFIWEDGEMGERMEAIAADVLEDAGLSAPTGLTYDLCRQGGYPRFGTSGPITVFGTAYTFDLDDSGQVTVWNADGDDLDDLPSGTIRDYEAEGNVYRAVRELADSLSLKMYAAMAAEDEYMSSEPQVSETSEANGWEYDERGNLA